MRWWSHVEIAPNYFYPNEEYLSKFIQNQYDLLSLCWIVQREVLKIQRIVIK